jgi:hypothetical protein
MGKIEEKIRADLMQNIFNDGYKIYEFIDSRFALGESDRAAVIEKINQLNNELAMILKEVKLS